MDQTNKTNIQEPQIIDTFDDVKILRYTFNEFQQLPLNRKKLLFYLSKAALSGRDIIFDQNFKYNLLIRKSLETIYEKFHKTEHNQEFEKFHNYLKKIWFSNGIHHPFSKEKIKPEFSEGHFHQLINDAFDNGLDHLFKTRKEASETLVKLCFDDSVAPNGVFQDPEKDMVKNSAVNFYENVTQEDAENFYNTKFKDEPKIPHGLNTKLVLQNNRIQEITWFENGMYGPAIKEITKWLEKALEHAENQKQKEWLHALIKYYKSGDLEEFNRYNISWVTDTASETDLINGFIETYSDPLGMKGAWESIVHFRDQEATKRTELLSKNAQWFEDNAPIDDRFKKAEVSGVTASVVNVAMLGGESYPTSPIGVNLPNADWIRKEYGSKSITLSNISEAHHKAMAESGIIEEFAFSQEEIKRNKKYGFLSNNLHTDLHECLGHGSGKLLEGVKAEMLKNYQAPIEEARADLFALYYLMDNKLMDLGILPGIEAAKAQYDSYIRNGLLTQLTKIKPGKNLEQAHMKNRQLISKWCFEKGHHEKIIERKQKENKTYFVVNSYNKLRKLFGKLLSEIQRIKSEGDYEEAKKLVELYGTKVDSDIHKEVIVRYEKLNIPPFTGFINPEYIPEYDANGEIQDININYSENYTQQMINYSKKYSFLSPEK